MDEAWDIASQIKQCMELDGGFGGTKERPGKHREAEIDGGGIERVNRIVELKA